MREDQTVPPCTAETEGEGINRTRWRAEDRKVMDALCQRAVPREVYHRQTLKPKMTNATESVDTREQEDKPGQPERKDGETRQIASFPAE